MTMTRFGVLLSCAALALTVHARAAAAPAQEPQQPPAAPPAAAKPAVEVPANWSYDPEGRRDPFESLLGRGRDPRSEASRPDGLAGVLIDDVTVRGIVQERDGFMATIRSADGKTYIVRPGDKLFDGSVKSILPDRVVFSQDVNDPLSLVKQREIPKPVRDTDGRGAAPSH